MALAFGVSSGVGAIAGLYGSIFVGFFAALLGGTPAQVSGPTGPMTVVMTTVVAALVSRYPETGLALAFTVVILGGLFQILFGLLRLGQYITLMPYTVVSGFMSGIGVIIIVIEIPLLLGHPVNGNVWETVQQLPTYFTQPNPVATGLGLLTLALVFATPRRLKRILPASLLALVTVTLLSVLVFGDADIPRIGTIPQGLPGLQIPTLMPNALGDVIRYGFMLGVLGAIDSLITSLVADNMTRTQHDSDRELIGQGIGNCLSGLFGGLPGAGATMRTMINVQAGGRTRLSGMIHALVLLLIVLWAAPLTMVIPHAVLAGLLLKVGVDIIDWQFIKRAHRLSAKGAGLMYLVLVLTVLVDLITAVVVGVFLANLLTIKRLTDVQRDRLHAITRPTPSVHLSTLEQDLLAQARGDILLFQLEGPLSFGSAKTIAQQMAIAQHYAALVLDLSQVSSIGVTAALAVETIVDDARKRQCPVWIVVMPGPVQRRIETLQLQRLFAEPGEHGLNGGRSPQIHYTENRVLALKAALDSLHPSRVASLISYD